MTRLKTLFVAAALVAGTTLATASPGASAAPREADSDFNGDGYSDLVVASPKDVTTVGTGAVYVVPGSASGVDASTSKIFTFADPIVGARTVAGDFNGDGFDDLAVTSEPGYSPDSFRWVGNVRVLYGTSTGLTTSGLQLFAPGSGGVPDTDESFGGELAAGDYDGDGHDDLVVQSSQGLWVFDGSSDGLDDTPANLGTPGSAMDSGDVDGDGFDDLAVGRSGAGYLTVLPGTEDGLTATGQQQLSQADLQQTGSAAPVEVVVGEFGRGAQADVAVSGNSSDRVSVVYGTADGITTTGRQLWDQASLSSIPGAAQTNGRFGFAMAAADFGYSSYDDLAVGAFQEKVKNVTEAGSVTVLVGTADGLVATHGKRWTQDTTGVSSVAEKQDWFGQSLQAGLFSKSSKAGLGVSAPYEAIGAKTRAGGVNVLYGSGTALTTTGNSFLTQDTAGVPGVVEQGDLMGFSGVILGEEGH